MTIRNTVTETVEEIRRTLYTDPVRTAVHRAGLNRTLSNIYWAVIFAGASKKRTHRINGIETTFLTPTRSEFDRFRNLMNEEPIIRDLLSNITADDIVYDVGANVGMYTCFAAAAVPSGEVIAFEPHPANIARLETNLENNDRTATICRSALSDSHGTVSFVTKGDQPGAGEHAIATEPTENTIDVDMTTGDALIEAAEIPAPTVIKIDVEGAELAVLRGLSTALDRDACRLVYCEIHPDKLPAYDGTLTEVEKTLHEHGFVLTEMTRGKERFLRAQKPSISESR